MAPTGEKNWFSPGEIRFTIHQTLWLLHNLGSLRDGHWPPEASNYFDVSKVTKTASHKAPFITPIEYAAEIETRLEECGTDGLILEAIECWGKSPESLASYFNRRPGWVMKRRKKALSYVASGPARRWHNIKKRKAETYQEFLGADKN